jgi:hypothetical protein
MTSLGAILLNDGTVSSFLGSVIYVRDSYDFSKGSLEASAGRK